VGSIEWFDFFVSKKRPKKSKIKIALSKKISGKIAKKSFSNKSRKFTFILDILLRGTDQMVRRIGYEVTDSLRETNLSIPSKDQQMDRIGYKDQLNQRS